MIKLYKIKKQIAIIFDLVCLNGLLHGLQIKLFHPFIRAINYHDIPANEARQFEQQLRYYAEHFASVNYQDLIQFPTGNWRKDKPGLIISFDDGFRSASEIAAPLLEKYGFTGWFFIPSGLVDLPVNSQIEEAARHRIFPKSYSEQDPRVFLTWEQIIELDQKHVIGCHTSSHCRLRSTLTENQLYEEIVNSKRILEVKLQHDVQAFAWVGGEEESYSREAAKALRIASYKFVFLTNNSLIRPDTRFDLLDRTNIESDFPLSLTRFQLSGFLDVLYTTKRMRVVSVVTE